MTKADLVRAAAKKSGYRKQDAQAIIEAAIETLSDMLISGEGIVIQDFGTLKAKTNAPRIRHNPRTMEAVSVPAHNVATFTASPALLERMNAK